jgi:hypothetical protein
MTRQSLSGNFSGNGNSPPGALLLPLISILTVLSVAVQLRDTS